MSKTCCEKCGNNIYPCINAGCYCHLIQNQNKVSRQEVHEKPDFTDQFPKPYNEYDHTHCFNDNQRPEHKNHLGCCLCQEKPKIEKLELPRECIWTDNSGYPAVSHQMWDKINELIEDRNNRLD